MQPNQRMLDSQGNEVCLFPLEYLHLSQGEHQLYAMDFLGWGPNGRIYDCPCYAPFSGSVVYTGNDHNMIYWSDAPVRCIDNQLHDVTILVAHSMTAPGGVGTHYTQGDLWYHTGNYGFSTGDHLHMEVALGHVTWAAGGLHLNSPGHIYDIMCVNDTVIDYGMGYNWRNYDGGVTPPTPVEEEEIKKFPWVLYARKLRNQRLN